MDVFAHGLWSYAILKKSKAPGLVIVTGMLPDLIPFIAYFIDQIGIRGIKVKFGPPPLETIPNYVFTAYNLSHSLVIVTLVFGLVFILTREIPLFLWAWPIHIAMDILTHTKAYFPTKFLYPLSKFHINGINWEARWFMVINYGSLLLIYFVILYWKFKRS